MPRRKQEEQTPERGLFEKVEGSGDWWIRYTDSEGRYRREKVGRRSDAVKLLEKRRTEARLGVKMPENLRHKGVTFQELADAILIHVTRGDYKDVRNVTARVKRLAEHFGKMEAEKILPEHISDWLAQNTSTPGTSNRYKSTLSLIYREGVRNRKVKQNPARLVRPARERNERVRWLQPEERARLFNVLEQDFPAHLPELIISLGTGMRLSEQYGLLWGDVDMKSGVIHLSDTKNNDKRSIPMSAEVKKAFRTLEPAGKHDRVFANKMPHRWWDDARAKAGLTDYVWHSNRHTFCTNLTEKGVHLKVIQKLAGHKTIAMTARYAKATDAAMLDAVALL